MDGQTKHDALDAAIIAEFERLDPKDQQDVLSELEVRIAMRISGHEPLKAAAWDRLPRKVRQAMAVQAELILQLTGHAPMPDQGSEAGPFPIELREAALPLPIGMQPLSVVAGSLERGLARCVTQRRRASS